MNVYNQPHDMIIVRISGSIPDDHKVRYNFVYRDGQGLGPLCLYIGHFGFTLSLSVIIQFDTAVLQYDS